MSPRARPDADARIAGEDRAADGRGRPQQGAPTATQQIEMETLERLDLLLKGLQLENGVGVRLAEGFAPLMAQAAPFVAETTRYAEGSFPSPPLRSMT